MDLVYVILEFLQTSAASLDVEIVGAKKHLSSTLLKQRGSLLAQRPAMTQA
jgi:hypothetical protein